MDALVPARPKEVNNVIDVLALQATEEPETESSDKLPESGWSVVCQPK
jgi:hypothetical protein